MNSQIAVVLVNYNGYRDTAECIDSILKSSINSAIVVVDSASKENEAEKLRLAYPIIAVIQSNVNLGFAGASNIGIRFALNNGYEYVLLLNNDTVVGAKTIEELASIANENIVSTALIYHYDEPSMIWYAGGSINRLTGRVRHFERVASKQNQTFASGCCMMVRREVFRDVGILDESYFMYCEDTDFCIRLLQSGKEIKLNTNAVLWHKVGRSAGRASDLAIYYNIRNMLKCVASHRAYFYFPAYSFLLVITTLKALRYKLSGKGNYKAVLLAFKDHFKKNYGHSRF
ncbi:MAG: glycosyltransferase family 2 protein [Clostridiales bacterium]|jgi:GT2 family glycosyltransferase|nr:glycosyltransferase family 2 protein [Clostridiales bacterium]